MDSARFSDCCLTAAYAPSRDEFSPFVLYRFVAINLGWMPNPAEFDGGFIDSRFACGAGNNGDKAENVENNPPIYFERNVRSMIAIARAHDITIMFASSAYAPQQPLCAALLADGD